MSETLQVLTELKRVLKEDADLEVNVSKTSFLPEDVPSFCPAGFVGIGVPIGTDVFVQKFAVNTCRTIIDDVEKLDAIHDGFVHYPDSYSGFPRTPDSNILIPVSYSVIDACSNSNMLIEKSLTGS